MSLVTLPLQEFGKKFFSSGKHSLCISLMRNLIALDFNSQSKTVCFLNKLMVLKTHKVELNNLVYEENLLKSTKESCPKQI